MALSIQISDIDLGHSRYSRSLPPDLEVYISDISAVPPKTMTFLEEAAACGIDLFMVDALSRGGHPTHMSLDEAVELVRKLRPSRMLTVWVWIGIARYISLLCSYAKTVEDPLL